MDEAPGIAPLDGCVFCGGPLGEGGGTMEDVFPKWLQREYDLANERLTLINGSTVTYSHLRVPACRPCNTVHASQLEQRISEDRASAQDMYVWLLKLQLGTLHWETARPLSQDRRRDESREPIVPSDAFDITFLHELFDVLKRPDPAFVPNPLGSVFCFPAEGQAFFYADKLYRHPLADLDGHNYSASCIVVHGRCWIALFDDGAQIRDRAVDIDVMNRQIAAGKDPVQFFPELMHMRACLDWLPHTVVLGATDGQPAQGVMFVPPMSRPRELPRRDEDLALFYAAVGFDVTP